MTHRYLRLYSVLAAFVLFSLSLVSPAAASGPPGPVLAWGWNNHGQIGDGTLTTRLVPTPVCAVGQAAPCPGQLAQAVQVAAGDDETSAALLSDGTVVTWGNNVTGALGDGTTTERTVPVRVCAIGQTAPCSAFLTGVTSIAAGRSHMLALLSDGSVASWGNNNQGQLGDGTLTGRLTPVRVCAVGQPSPCTAFLTGVSGLVGGNNHSVALLTDGSVLTWGNNDFGQLGDGTTSGRVVPVRVCATGQTAPCAQFLTGVAALGPGLLDNSIVVGPSGSVLTWGNNFFGQLGDGTTTDRWTPVLVCAVGQTAPCSSTLSGITSVAAGSFSHSLAVGSGGAVFAWGNNGSGKLGDGTLTDRSTPVRVCAVGQTAPCSSLLSSVTSSIGGDDHSLTIVAPPAADIEVRLDASSSLLNPTVTYTLTAINRGPGTVSSGTLSLQVPTPTASVNASGCTYTPANRTVTCPVGQLGVRQARTFTVRATMGVLTVGLPLNATATRTASTPADPNPANDSATESCLVVTGLIILC